MGQLDPFLDQAGSERHILVDVFIACLPLLPTVVGPLGCVTKG
jgi:hypothetical protein